MDANRQDRPQNERHHVLEDLGDRASGAQSVDRVREFDPQAPVDLYASVRRPTVYLLRVIQKRRRVSFNSLFTRRISMDANRNDDLQNEQIEQIQDLSTDAAQAEQVKGGFNPQPDTPKLFGGAPVYLPMESLRH